MAQITHRANLSMKKVPLLSTDQGRSVIVKGQDQNFLAQSTSEEDKTYDMGIAQVYYMENVMPTSQGYQSVGFKTFVAGDGTIAEISSTFPLRNPAGARAQLGVDSTTGKIYVLKQGSTQWTLVTTVAAAIGKLVSVATVAGESYIFIEGVNCYLYDFTLETLSTVTLSGLTVANILLIVAVAGYLQAYSSDSVAWSSTIDPTDFVPSLATGAGGGGIEGAEGKVVFVVPVYGGAVIFTDSNAVACTTSDNSRYPFRFTPIIGAGGLSTPEYCVTSASSSAVYAYTTSGLQTLNLRSASTINPDITDFLSGEVIESFNSSNNTLAQKSVLGVMRKKIAFIADRYLVLSFGEGALTAAIVLDVILKQYGKISIPHVSCFEFTLYDQAQWDTPKKSIALVSGNGKISLVDFTFTSNHQGVILLGKFQYVRTRFLQLEGVEVSNVYRGETFTCHSIPSLNGEDAETPVEGFLVKEGNVSKVFAFHSNGLNHSILMKGNFDLSTVLLTFTVGGGR